MCNLTLFAGMWIQYFLTAMVGFEIDGIVAAAFTVATGAAALLT